MTREAWESFRAQTPPPGFADRVVLAALRERRARWGRVPHPHARRAAFAAVAATLLVGGVAWGFSAWMRPAAVVPAGPSATTSAPPQDRPVRAVPSADLDAGTERDAMARMPAQPVLHRLKSVKVAEAKGDGGAKVIVPPCECARDQVICTCF